MKKLQASAENADYNSLLWNDLYKFSMQYAVLVNFPQAVVEYELFDRGCVDFPDNFDFELKKIINNYTSKKMSKIRKMEFMAKCPYLPNWYFDFLEHYTYDPNEVICYLDENKHLKVKIKGFWYRTILWEVPLMADICELYYKMTGVVYDFDSSNTANKAVIFRNNGINYADFGTRRAFSRENHHNVFNVLLKESYDEFIGTSNVELGLAYNTKIVGTYAHEFVSGVAALNGYIHANYHAMEIWSKTYNGDLGIALTDTFTTLAFLKDFNSKYSKLFDGVRHDSGCPLAFTDMMIHHYKSLKINPQYKTVVYSDGLNVKKVLEISEYRKNEINKSYGIGTNFTCDISCVKPMNIVIKLVKINNNHVIKISDDLKKSIGDKQTIEFGMFQINNLLKS